jgi:predicted lipoprotein with Yx(FWY)xxD motif
MLPSGRALVLQAAGALLLASACGGNSASNAPASTPVPSPTPTPNVLAKSETVAGQSMTILVDANGMTVYRWAKDSGAGLGKINCVGGCAAVWPPFVLTSGSTAAVAGSGVIAAKLTTLTNPEGKGTQVVYAGFPLYYYAKDKAPGDTTGQGVGGTWFVVTPDQAPNA